MQLHEKAIHEELTYFVGRTKELEIMHNHVTGGWKWRWLHIYGPSGTGKSTLFKQFKSHYSGAHLFDLDVNNAIQQEEINRRIQSFEPPLILLIDSFEQWGSAQYWLSQWKDPIKSTVCIITAGQNRLIGEWLRSGWASLIHSIQLQTLTPVEVEQYAQKRGMTDPHVPSRLYRFSRGVPLAMMLAAEVMLRGDDAIPFDHKDQFHLTSLLMNELFKSMPSSTHQLLEAASVYWRFNEERLAAIVEGEITAAAFQQLVQQSFVILRDDGWTLHDAVRTWVLENFIRRKPQTYEQMRRKALAQILLEEQLLPYLRDQLYVDKFNLHENPVVRAVCFSGHQDNLELRECRECDLPTIRALYVHYHLYAEPTLNEAPHMGQLISLTWKVAPSSFMAIWKQDTIVASYGKVPLNHSTLRVLATEPLLEPFLQQFTPTPHAYLLSFIGIIPDLAENTRAYIMNAILRHFHYSEWIIAITPLKEWFPVFELVGFERASWADSMTSLGTEYRAFVLDLREEDFLSKLNRKLSVSSTEEASKQKEETHNIHHLKKLMKNWSPLPYRPDLIKIYTDLFPHRMAFIGMKEGSGLDVQQDLYMTIQLLFEGNEQEAILGTLLTYTYIQGIQPHDRVAKQLNLSLATYYRYLNKALRQLYLLLSGSGA